MESFGLGGSISKRHSVAGGAAGGGSGACIGSVILLTCGADVYESTVVLGAPTGIEVPTYLRGA